MAKKKKKRKKKPKIGLGWGNADFYGAIPAEGGGSGDASSGAMGEHKALKEYIQALFEKSKEWAPRQ